MTDDNIQKTTFQVPDGVDGLHIVGSPTGGTFRLTNRHVSSAAIMYNASAEEIHNAGAFLAETDAEITTMHLENPEKYADCHICFPPPAPVLTFPVKVRRGLSAWWNEAKRRTWYAMEALRGRYY